MTRPGEGPPSDKRLAFRLSTYVRRRWNALLWRNSGTEMYTGVLVVNQHGIAVLSQPKPVIGVKMAPCNLIGLASVTVTPAMVGRTFAVFTAIECKAKGSKETEKQTLFLRKVKDMGGFADFAYAFSDANRILELVDERKRR